MNLLALQQLQQTLAEAIQHGNDKRASELLLDFKKQHPKMWALFSSLFAGTPEDLVERASAYWPSLRTMPGAVEFERKLQTRINEEVNKKRGGNVAPESKRLKG